MKKLPLLICGVLGCTALAQADTVNLLFDAGILRNATGSAVVANGSLVQILASPSKMFPAPTSSSYVSGDNVLLRSFAMNSNSGVPGELVSAGNIGVNSGTSVASGEAIILRFFPNISFAAMGNAPAALTSFGQVRSDTVEFGPAGGDASETAWVLPGGGASVDLDYITSDDGGTYAPATAYATGVVTPEPTALAVLSLAGFCGRRRRVK